MGSLPGTGLGLQSSSLKAVKDFWLPQATGELGSPKGALFPGQTLTTHPPTPTLQPSRLTRMTVVVMVTPAMSPWVMVSGR